MVRNTRLAPDFAFNSPCLSAVVSVFFAVPSFISSSDSELSRRLKNVFRPACAWRDRHVAQWPLATQFGFRERASWQGSRIKHSEAVVCAIAAAVGRERLGEPGMPPPNDGPTPTAPGAAMPRWFRQCPVIRRILRRAWAELSAAGDRLSAGRLSATYPPARHRGCPPRRPTVRSYGQSGVRPGRRGLQRQCRHRSKKTWWTFEWTAIGRSPRTRSWARFTPARAGPITCRMCKTTFALDPHGTVRQRRPHVQRVQRGVVLIFRVTERPLLKEVEFVGNMEYQTSA